ncbi:hypothetical protein CWN50_12975 [Klebsiella michiganensis]|uniref:Uncharacterized protein n=2 Tax=Klebsiella TaxID=570 RepID=A0A2J4R9L0_9ENTR|nr:hypothetical protein CWN50_12975 [Klebsiella michiganensis]
MLGVVEMLPAKIMDLVNKLTEMTKKGNLKWEYDYYNDKVTAHLDYFTISMMYVFDSDTGIAYIHVDYLDNSNGQWYRFTTDSNYYDFSAAKLLYDEAQASQFDVKF